MINQVRNYDNLNSEEKQIMDEFRQLKLTADYNRYILYKFQIDDLLENYDQMKQIREVIQMKFFAIMDNLRKDDLIEGGPEPEKWNRNRDQEKLVWKVEMQLLDEINSNLSYAINMIESGEAEKVILEAENW